jgi:hypothetical protein
MSAGFMGVARVRRRRVEGGRVGEMEWVCSLQYHISISFCPAGD